MPTRVDTRHRELSRYCWPARVLAAALPADVGQVMALVARHGVGDGAYAADGPVSWCAARPRRGVQATRGGDEGGAHRGDVGHDIAGRPLSGVGGRRAVHTVS